MGTQDINDGRPAFARGMAGPFGKFDHEIKAHLDEATFNAWLRLCASGDKTSSELLRDAVYLIVHGATPSEMSSKNTRALLNMEGPNGARARLVGGAQP